MTLTPAAARPAPLPTPAALPGTAERHSRALDYERVLHQLARREFAVLADLASWAPAGDRQRAARLSRHAELVIRVLIQHHTAEGGALWPALVRHLPDEEQEP